MMMMIMMFYWANVNSLFFISNSTKATTVGVKSRFTLVEMRLLCFETWLNMCFFFCFSCVLWVESHMWVWHMEREKTIGHESLIALSQLLPVSAFSIFHGVARETGVARKFFFLFLSFFQIVFPFSSKFPFLMDDAVKKTGRDELVPWR